MIKLSELRIGNYVHVYQVRGLGNLSNQEIVMIDRDMKITFIPMEYKEVSVFGTALFRILEEDYQPIPLTPEILESCGWKCKNTLDGEPHILDLMSSFTYGDGNIALLHTYLPEMTGEVKMTDKPINYFYRLAKPIFYLHELQNFHYALTGEELEINETVLTT